MDRKKDEKLCECKIYSEELLRSLRKLQVNDELCDFTVSAEGKSIRVHKVVLAATSEYFRALLRVYMMESKNDTVDLRDISASFLEKIIDFIYTGNMDLNFSTLTDVLSAANHLQIPSALNLCSEYIISELTFSNAEELMKLADIYNLYKVTEYFTEKLLNNFDTFASTSLFLSTSFSILSSYLSDDRLKTQSESNLLDYLLKWLNYNQSKFSLHIPSLLLLVRFGLISKSKLEQKHPIFTNFPSCLSLLEEGLKFHEDLLTHHPSPLPSHRIRSTSKSLVLVINNSNPHSFEIFAHNSSNSNYYKLTKDTYACRDCRIVEIDNFLYIFRVMDSGGGIIVNSLVRFDPRHLSLVVLSPCQQVRIDSVVVSVDFKIYSFGGFLDLPQESSAITITNLVHVYNSLTNTWSDLPPLPEATYGHAACTLDGKIYLSGGVTLTSNSQATSTLLLFDPSSNTYSSKQPMLFPRRLHEMQVLNGSIYVLGGIGSHSFDQQKNQIPIEMYSPREDQWIALTNTLAGRSIGHFISCSNQIFSLGREHRKATEEDIWSYDPVQDQWTPFTKSPSKMSLAFAWATQLHINFDDERVSKRIFHNK